MRRVDDVDEHKLGSPPDRDVRRRRPGRAEGAPFEKMANEDKERYVKECKAGALTAPCNGAFVPICMPGPPLARLTTQPSAMFLGSTSLREWAVSVGCPVPTNGAGGFHPFFDELNIFSANQRPLFAMKRATIHL